MAAKSDVKWDAVHRALEQWRKNLHKEREDSGVEKEPAVTTVAEHYRHDPWPVLVSTILSLRTKDDVTLETSRRLLEKATGPRELAAMREDQVARLAYPAGFYRTKAANLKKIAALLLDEYEGKVPSDLETLLSLPGVGRKTANLVIIEAYGKDGICVDVHVHRISNRTGWLCSRNPEETEMKLRQILPRKFWKALNPFLVLYGQNICRPISPHCSQCVIAPHCARIGVGKSR
ncbi:MAG: endonuclease III [Treponema sp.]|jgi:endonuclease-3|nr:endonuclease III [Treponema sp.]